MANIDVQKKKSNPWPWIILLLILAAIAGYFIWRNSNEEAVITTPNTDSTINRTDTTRQ